MHIIPPPPPLLLLLLATTMMITISPESKVIGDILDDQDNNTPSRDRDSSLHYQIQTGSVTHPVLYPMDTRSLIHNHEAAKS
jgi:hypothetical protein